MKKICILLATFNGELYLKEQIRSLLKQVNVNITLVVSDDLSSDKTVKILKKYKKFKIIFLENSLRHGSAGRNFLSMIERVDFSLYDYVSFSDQDDIWYEDKLANSLNFLEENKHFIAVSSCVNAFWMNQKSLFVKKSFSQTDYDHIFEAAGPGCTYLMKTELIYKIQQLIQEKKWIYEEVALHDWLIYSYARENGYKWHILPYSTLDYRQHSNNQLGVNSGIVASLNRLQKFNNGWYFDQIYSISRAVGSELKLNKLFTSRSKPTFHYFKNFWKMRRDKLDGFLLLLCIVLKIIK